MESKQVLQAAILLALVLFTALYVYINVLVAPLRNERDSLQTSVAASQASITSSGAELHKILNEEKAESQNGALDQLLDRLMQTTPKVPLVTCPSILSKLMIRHGIADNKINVRAYLPFPGIATGVIQSWGISSPAVKAFTQGEAIAEMENQYPISQIGEFTIDKSRADGSLQSDVAIQIATFQ